MDCKRKVSISGDDILGYVYPIKDDLKKYRCKWDAKTKLWSLTKESDLVEVSRIINEYNEKMGLWEKCVECSGKCRSGYTLCYNCYNTTK
jgi:hypothetical protein